MKAAAWLLLPALACAARAQGDPFESSSRLPRIRLGPAVVIGEDHPLFELEDFAAESDGAGVGARWVEGSLKWTRGADGLALPQARLRVSTRSAPERTLLRVKGRAVAFQEDGAGGALAELFMPLFETIDAVVEVDGKPAGRIRAFPRPAARTPRESRHAVDHSCSPWALSLRGLDDSFASLNCRMLPVGRLGAEEPLLEVRLAAAPARAADGGAASLVVLLRGVRPAKTTLLGPDGKPRTVELAAALPARWRRARLAGGVGPYGLSSSAPAGNGYATSVMLYGNLRLRHDDDLSLRAFEAAIAQGPETALFNNLGVYFAYDLRRVLDKRLSLTALLGMQEVTFAPAGWRGRAYSEGLYPQGFELAYADPLGWRAKTVSIGVFLQPTASKRYQNYWIRAGGRVFGELNYLQWRSGDRFAKAWGVSVGFPLAQAL